MRLIDIEPILDAAELAGKEYVSIDFLKDFEQLDAVPVVRCVECKHYNTTGYPALNPGTGWCERMGRGVSDDFYCSYGAKMEDKP